MLARFIKKLNEYFSTIFLLSIFLGAIHHHNDLKIHDDCKICVLQTNIANGDTPPQNIYLADIALVYEAILNDPVVTHTIKLTNQLHQRAPPFYI